MQDKPCLHRPEAGNKDKLHSFVALHTCEYTFCVNVQVLPVEQSLPQTLCTPLQVNQVEEMHSLQAAATAGLAQTQNSNMS